MLFKSHVLAGLADGTVTLAFRRWRRPTVRAGGTLMTPAGLLAIDAVAVIDPAAITATEARRAGYASREALLSELASRAEGAVHRVAFRRIGPDPRAALRDRADMAAEALAALARLDARRRTGPWTCALLALIAMRPATRAADLAAALGRGTLPLKADIRRLKALGLTESLDTGYRLSPRGEAVLRALGQGDRIEAPCLVGSRRPG